MKNQIYPKHLNVDDQKGLSAFFLDMLVLAATECASKFSAPVYLVGSSLVSENPLDIDIVLVLNHRQYFNIMGCTEDTFQELFTGFILHGPYLRYSRLIKKQKAYFEGFLGCADVDFKIQIESKFSKKTGLRVRIDQLQDLF